MRPFSFAVAALALAACGGSEFTSASGSSSGDGGVDGARDDGATSSVNDAGDAATAPGGGHALACGGSTCTLGAETCCAYTNDNGDRSFSCSQTTTCPDMPNTKNVTALQCAETADCPPGRVCCIGQANGGFRSQCALACQGAELCDPNAIPTGCTLDAPCSSNNIGGWGLAPPYATCGGRGP